MSSSENRLRRILAEADVEIGGSRPWDVLVHDERLYDRIFAQGSLGIGESYMDGWWDAHDLAELVSRILRSTDVSRILSAGLVWQTIRARLFNPQSRLRAFDIGQKHYDIGNDLYQSMLDARMNYSCAHWQHASSLDEAQEKKLDLICRKIGIRKGDRVLDVGCGWGGFAIFAAERYGARVVGITVSEQQVHEARRRAGNLPIDIRLQDWRDVPGETYDHIVSIGMFEHVGPKNYRAFMKKMRSLLRPDGLFLLHTIGDKQSTASPDPWIDRYIFPNGHLPSAARISASIDRGQYFDHPSFVIEDWHNFGIEYDQTLSAWYRRFEGAWPELRPVYGDRFFRMWRYYLLSCAGAFRARALHLWQVVLSPKGVAGGYQSVR